MIVRTLFRAGVLLLILITLTTLVSSDLQAQANSGARLLSPEIHLASRTFTPAEGIDPALLEHAGVLADGWHGLIQLFGVPDATQRQILSDAGVQLLTYVPNNSWMASLPADLENLMATGLVRWVGSLKPADRMEAALYSGEMGDWALNSDGTVALWITYFPDVPATVASAVVTARGGSVSNVLLNHNRLHAAIAAGAILDLGAEDSLQWIAQTPPPFRTLNDGQREVIVADPVQVPPYMLSGDGIQVAIWEGGSVDETHPDLAGRVTTVEAGDVTNHATVVAGNVGGNGISSIEYGGDPEQWRGIAPAVEIFAYLWGLPTIDHDNAINVYGVDVSQNSWALGSCSYNGTYDSYAHDYDEIITGFYGRGLPVVFAAGNQQERCIDPYGTVHGGPQSAKNTLTIGAIYSEDSSMTSFSSWGPVGDGRIKPEVVAAGKSNSSSGIHSTRAGGGYADGSGTSMAAPAVSGSIALLLEEHQRVCPVGGDSEGNPLPSTTKALLLHAADDLDDPATSYFHPGPDYSSGFGRVNVLRTVDIIRYYLQRSLSHGEIDSYAMQLSEPGPLKVTLAWDDIAAAPGVSVALVNDLDLELLAPDGVTVYGPWLLDADSPEQPASQGQWILGEAGERDDRNVEEQVIVANADAGIWTVRVLGANVPAGPQSYSLVSEALEYSDCTGSPTAISMQSLEASPDRRAGELLAVLLGMIALAGAVIYLRPQARHRRHSSTALD